jgi:hypothetical protein
MWVKGKGRRKAMTISGPPKGSHRILVTCEARRSRKAVHLALKLCESFVPVQEAPAGSEELSVEDELAQVRGVSQKSRFIPYMSDVAGNFFIRFVDKQDDPFALVERYFQSIRRSGRSVTTHVTRLYPILATGSPGMEESPPVLQELLPRVFKGDDPKRYQVFIQRKHKGEEQQESHDELNRKIIDSVGCPHQAMYDGSDTVVLWISLSRHLYMSVVPRWKEWCACNVPRFCAQLKLAGRMSNRPFDSKFNRFKRLFQHFFFGRTPCQSGSISVHVGNPGLCSHKHDYGSKAGKQVVGSL